MKITPQDIVGLVGILPTPATPNADRWESVDTVNLAESERMTRMVVEAGTDIIVTTGTFGECATLTARELRDFVGCVAETVARRKLVFAGVTTLNTRDTIERGRAVLDAGADGLFVGRPMWLALDDKLLVRFYRDVAEALSGVPLIVYDNPVAFKGKISQAAYRELAAIPEIVSAKHVGGPALEADLHVVGEQCRLLPMAGDWLDAAQAHPETCVAAWSGAVACAPAALVALATAIKERDWTRAKNISDKCRWAEVAMFAGGDLAAFMDYSIAIAHWRVRAAGLVNPGPSRPPYLDSELPENYKAGAIECGKRWAQLQQEYGQERVGFEDASV